MNPFYKNFYIILSLLQGRPFEYNGPREKANIIQFMRQQQQPPSLEVSTASALANSLDRREVTVLGLFKCKSDLFEEFMVAANEMRGSYRYLDGAGSIPFAFSSSSIVFYVPLQAKYKNWHIHLN
jgi:hypothetical protein